MYVNMPGFCQRLVVLFAATALTACERPPQDDASTAADDRAAVEQRILEPAVTGVVQDASGTPVAGALVKVRGADTGLSYMVVSQAGGRYATPRLLPGRYTVQAIGGRYQSDDSRTVTVEAGGPAQADLVLDAAREIPPPAKQLAYPDYLALMPEGEAKGLIASRCVMCHGLDRVVPARKAPQAWQITVDRMAYFLEERPDLGGPLPDEDKQAILDYVSTHFTPDAPRIRAEGSSDPNRHLPVELLQGEEAGFIAVEFDPKTPVRNPETEFGIGPDGDAWISEGGTTRLGRFDPDTLTYTRIEAPPGNFTRTLGQIAVDPEGVVWVLDNGPAPHANLLSYDPRAEAFREYPIAAPLRYRAPLNSIVFLDGDVWGTGNASSRVVRLDPDTGDITAYPATRGSHPFGITVGSDGAIWYITNYNNQIIRLDPETGEQTPYEPPTKKSGLRRLGADAEGNLWAAAQDSNMLVKVDSSTGEVKEYPIPTPNSAPYSVDVDTTRNLVWVSQRDANQLARFNPRTETFVEFPLPVAGIEAQRILVDPLNPDRVWWQCSTGCIGYIEITE